MTGGAEKDDTEAKREQAAEEAAQEEEAFGEAASPQLVVEPEGFEDGIAGSTADAACEALVVVSIAALLTGAIHLARWRPTVLSILLSVLALWLGALAFLNSAT